MRGIYCLVFKLRPDLSKVRKIYSDNSEKKGDIGSITTRLEELLRDYGKNIPESRKAVTDYLKEFNLYKDTVLDCILKVEKFINEKRI